MSLARTLEPDVGRKAAKKGEGEPEARRFPALVRISEEAAQLARELAPMKGQSMAELLSETLKPILEKMLEEEMRKRLGGKR